MASRNPDQDGYLTAGGTYDETSVTMGGVGANYIGMRFQISNHSLDSESRALDPIRLYSPFTLTLYTASVPNSSCLVTARFVPEVTPAAYSDSLLPGSRDDGITGTGVFKTSLEATVDATETVAASTVVDSAVTWTDLDIYSLVQKTNTATWNGYICLTLQIITGGSALLFHTTEAANSALWPVLTTNEVAFHTGVLNGPAVGRRARSRIDPKLGIPVASDELVRDGYHEGLMVHPDAWDPEDPEDRYVPNPHEGVVDDEV